MAVWILTAALLFHWADGWIFTLPGSTCIRPNPNQEEKLRRYPPGSNQRDATPPFMGGYYNEPEDSNVDLVNSHMVFGMRCREVKTAVQNKGNDGAVDITNLIPMDDENQEHDVGPQLLRYIQKQNISLTDKTVVEVGCSSVGLAASLVLGAKQVTVYHPDQTRLLVLEHAKTLLNSNLKQQPSQSCELRTVVLRDGLSLPPADVVFLTGKTDIDTSKWLHQAVNQGSRVLVPSQLFPDEKELQQRWYQYRHTDDNIFDIEGREWTRIT